MFMRYIKILYPNKTNVATHVSNIILAANSHKHGLVIFVCDHYN